MLIDNKNLFPLYRLGAHFKDYFMDGEGNIFSTKRGGVLKQLWGSRSTNRYGRSSGGTRYSLGGLTYDSHELVAMASRDSTFNEETHDPKKKLVGGYGPKTLSAASLGVDLTKIKAPIPPIERSHATSVESGIEGKGWIIAAYKSGIGLIFSKQPAIHLTAESAKSEMERLAKEVPGQKFVLLRILNTIVSGGVTWN